MEQLSFAHQHGIFTPEFSRSWTAFHEQVAAILQRKGVSVIHLQVSGAMVGEDYDRLSLDYLRDQLLIDATYLQLALIRQTLKLIQRSAATWVMSIEGNPIGLCFEMALACSIALS